MSSRPDPDELLRRVNEEERKAKRGKLTIFFGASPGVGKTYAMLAAAQAEHALGRDVLVGVVETHGRAETVALTKGLHELPRRPVEHRGVVLREFDLEQAIVRHPSVILLDELAHTNAPGSHHAKRWQDVEDLLVAGIDVYSTLNVQHIESLNDVVAQITGVVVRETVPDKILEDADEIRLVDLPADELLERLHEGKVYVADQAQRAIQNFFRKGNLIALRELALRRTAEAVDDQMHDYKRVHGVDAAWPVAERILVCVSASPESAKLVRAARRMAAGLRAEWIAVYVETPAALRLTASDRERVAQNLRLAEELGAETIRLSGESPAEETLRYARERNVTKVVLGKPTHPRWRDLIKLSFLEEMVRNSRDIDVYVISGEGFASTPRPSETTPKKNSWKGFASAAAAIAVSAIFSQIAFGRAQLSDAVMVHLLGIVLVAVRFGYGPSIFASVLSVLVIDFFFVPPFYSFTVSDFQHVVMFAVMFVVAVVISNLTKRIQDQAESARQREKRTARLYAMSRELATASTPAELVHVVHRQLHDSFAAEVGVFLPSDSSKLEVVAEETASLMMEGNDFGVAHWVWEHEKPAGLNTDTLPSARAFFLALRGSKEKVGVLGIRPANEKLFLDPDQRQLLDVFAGQIGSAIERLHLGDLAQQTQVQIEAERLRNTLLSSVSHDLRTPLGVITGAASTLRDDEATLGASSRRALVETIQEEVDRLNRLVRNLLDMTRLESGKVSLKKEWQPIEEVVGVVLDRMETRLHGRKVTTDLPSALVPFDSLLIEQLLINLVENAVKYSSNGIDIRATNSKTEVVFEVADRGPGVAEGERARIFEKFERGKEQRVPGGVGLGLAICRAIVTAHGGRIWVENRAGGGAVFKFTLPHEGEAPRLSMLEPAVDGASDAASRI